MKVKIILLIIVIGLGAGLYILWSEKRLQDNHLVQSDQNNSALVSMDQVLTKEILDLYKDITIRNSKANTDYLNDGKVSISSKLNNQESILQITIENLKETSCTNFPRRISLEINNSRVTFESLWNDGLHVSIADFDKSDNDTDIYITEMGTDVGCHTYLYKFDGLKLSQYASFNHIGIDFKYDENGKIYFSRDGNRMVIDTCYDYRTKETSGIADQQFKIFLNN